MHDQNAFSDDETGASTLNIIFLHEIGRICVGCTISGQRRHSDAVLKGHIADLEGIEKSFGG